MAIDNLSFVIAADFPKEMAQFYSSLTKGELRIGFTNQDFNVLLPNGSKIYIYKPSSKKQFPKRGNVMSLCLNSEANDNPLEYLTKWINKLVKCGASVSVRPKLEDFGAESWMKDPEGNSFLVFVPFKM
tara:strand:- start:463 stop:849 length:387 start_codon:yes stop_codon:yes gene_type:complete